MSRGMLGAYSGCCADRVCGAEVKAGRPVRRQARVEMVEVVRRHRFWSVLKVKLKDLTIGLSNSTPRCIYKEN